MACGWRRPWYHAFGFYGTENIVKFTSVACRAICHLTAAGTPLAQAAERAERAPQQRAAAELSVERRWQLVRISRAVLSRFATPLVGVM
jgi:hypothetical protein